jgi:hypothetical protein
VSLEREREFLDEISPALSDGFVREAFEFLMKRSLNAVAISMSLALVQPSAYFFSSLLPSSVNLRMWSLMRRDWLKLLSITWKFIDFLLLLAEAVR